MAMHTALSGEIAIPRGLTTREAFDFSVTIHHAEWLCHDLSGRKMVPSLGIYEGLQLVGQTSEPDMSERWPGLARFRDDGVFDGSYAVRVHGMLGRIEKELKSDRHSRRAVLTIHNTREDLPKALERDGTKDVPCTLAIQFLLRRDMLRMRVTMRSNDAWLGLPYDLWQFGMLHTAFAHALEVGVGPYTHSVGSLHVYQEHFSDAHQIVVDNAGAQHVIAEWGGDYSIAAVSRRARMLLHGESLGNDESPFESFMRRQLV